MGGEYDIIIRISGEYSFLTEGGHIEYTEPSQPGRELVGDLSLVALPYECTCGYPNYAVSEAIFRGDPAISRLVGECKNCRKLVEPEVIFDHAVHSFDSDALRLLDISTGRGCAPLQVSDTHRAKKTLNGYP